MNSLKDLPTWEPYIRVTTMLRFLGHSIKPHKALSDKKILEKIEHKYYPFIAGLFEK